MVSLISFEVIPSAGILSERSPAPSYSLSPFPPLAPTFLNRGTLFCRYRSAISIFTLLSVFFQMSRPSECSLCSACFLATILSQSPTFFCVTPSNQFSLPPSLPFSLQEAKLSAEVFLTPVSIPKHVTIPSNSPLPWEAELSAVRPSP